MLGRDLRRPYWRDTKLQTAVSLLVPLVLLPAIPIAILDINSRSFLGFPLGYLLAAHGFIILGFLSVIQFVRRQDRIDTRHGANEDI